MYHTPLSKGASLCRTRAMFLIEKRAVPTVGCQACYCHLARRLLAFALVPVPAVLFRMEGRDAQVSHPVGIPERGSNGRA